MHTKSSYLIYSFKYLVVIENIVHYQFIMQCINYIHMYHFLAVTIFYIFLKILCHYIRVLSYLYLVSVSIFNMRRSTLKTDNEWSSPSAHLCPRMPSWPNHYPGFGAGITSWMEPMVRFDCPSLAGGSNESSTLSSWHQWMANFYISSFSTNLGKVSYIGNLN